jgi:hypothetical protein
MSDEGMGQVHCPDVGGVPTNYARLARGARLGVYTDDDDQWVIKQLRLLRYSATSEWGNPNLTTLDELDGLLGSSTATLLRSLGAIAVGTKTEVLGTSGNDLAVRWPGNAGTDYVDPVVEYPHDEGVSITGGYVSRNPNHPQLEGVYLYADLVSGRVWGIRCEGGKRVAGPEIVAQTKNHLPTSFGEAGDGTIYMTTFEGSQDTRAKGAIWRIAPVE